MASELPLNSLQIKNFRGIRDLKIERLGRGNLIVGKNNVGKSTLLEAIRLYAKPGSIDELLDILVIRNEIGGVTLLLGTRIGFLDPIPLENLFFGRGPYRGSSKEIVIGELDGGTKPLNIRYVEAEAVLQSEDRNNDFNILLHTRGCYFKSIRALVAFVIEGSSSLTRFVTIDPEIGRSIADQLQTVRKQFFSSFAFQFIGSEGF